MFSDIWSFGVLCIEVFLDAEKPKFEPPVDYGLLYNRYLTGERYPRPSGCHRDVYDVILQCWEMDGKNRIHYKKIQTLFTRY